MARVVVTETARADLDRLLRTHGLPPSTRDRVRAAVEPLRTFPLLGRSLPGRWAGFRVVLGPWPWMLLVYAYDEPTDLVAIVTIQDSRSARAVTAEA
jgi:plasmid stabilization system protein ParE